LLFSLNLVFAQDAATEPPFALLDYPWYECEGIFRPGHECWKAVDGNWWEGYPDYEGACPDAYGDAIAVIENYPVPSGISGANWTFEVFRNAPQIEVWAYYWDYATDQWELIFEAPQSDYIVRYTVPIPADGLLSSPLKTKMHVRNATMPMQSGYYYEGAVDWIYPNPGYECEGQFRPGYECWRAVDGDTMTSAVPDAYGDSVAVIEYHSIPSGVSAANWRFRVLRNNPAIRVTAYYWDCSTGGWVSFFDVPESNDYITYTVPIPAGGLSVSPLKTKVKVRNAYGMSGEYFEGAVDWIYPDPSPAYECEGIFRPGNECLKAVDGYWPGAYPDLVGACPNAYGDSIAVIENYPIPSAISGANWTFRVFRNYPSIEVWAYYWDYTEDNWVRIYEVPQNWDLVTYSVPIPASGLSSSPLKTKVRVRNGSGVSGYYCEGGVDWIYPEPHYAYEGCFRPGFECQKAVDGDWWSGDNGAGGACPDQYGDSVAVIENHPIPSGISVANWTFKVLRNAPQIEVWAYCWDYTTSEWELIYEVPEIVGDTATFTKHIPAGGLLSSPLKTKMHVRNATMPKQSGYYFEGVVDWVSCYCGEPGDVDNSGGPPTPLDVTYLVQKVYKSQDALYDYYGLHQCPYRNGDVYGDGGDATPLDVAFLVQKVYKSQDALCQDRCAGCP